MTTITQEKQQSTPDLLSTSILNELMRFDYLHVPVIVESVVSLTKKTVQAMDEVADEVVKESLQREPENQEEAFQHIDELNNQGYEFVNIKKSLSDGFDTFIIAVKDTNKVVKGQVIKVAISEKHISINCGRLDVEKMENGIGSERFLSIIGY